MKRTGRAFVALLAFAAALALPTPALALPTPAHAAAVPGWKAAFSTEFSGTALPAGCGKYGGPYEGGATFWDDQNVVVSGGLLRIVMEQRAQGGMPYTAGGMGCFDHAQTYGKFEWRAKVPPGKGIDSYATLWMSRAGDDGNESLVEILGTPGHEVMAVSDGYGSGLASSHVSGHYADGFHVYTIEWTPAQFRLLVDGVARFTNAHVPKVSKWIGFAVSNGDNFAGLPDAATQFPAEFQVDWVHTYTYVPDAPPPPPATPSSPSRTPASASGQSPAGPSGQPSVTGPAGAAPDRIAVAGDTDEVDPATGRFRRPAWVWLAVGALLAGLAAGGLRLLWVRRRDNGRHSA